MKVIKTHLKQNPHLEQNPQAATFHRWADNKPSEQQDDCLVN